MEAVGSPAPPSVTRSFGLWVTSVVVCIAVAGYAYTKLEEFRPGLREAILAQDPTITTESLDRVVAVSQFVAIGAIVLFALLELVFASLMRRGRHWARILLATVGLISLPTFVIVRGLLALDRALLTDYVLLGLGLYVLLMLAAVVTMFLPPANEWFRSVRGRYR